MNHGVRCPRVPMPRRGAVVGVRLTRCAVRAGLLSNETEEFNLDSSPTVGSSTLFGTGSFHGSRNRKRERKREREPVGHIPRRHDRLEAEEKSRRRPGKCFPFSSNRT